MYPDLGASFQPLEQLIRASMFCCIARQAEESNNGRMQLETGSNSVSNQSVYPHLALACYRLGMIALGQYFTNKDLPEHENVPKKFVFDGGEFFEKFFK